MLHSFDLNSYGDARTSICYLGMRTHTFKDFCHQSAEVKLNLHASHTGSLL